MEKIEEGGKWDLGGGEWDLGGGKCDAGGGKWEVGGREVGCRGREVGTVYPLSTPSSESQIILRSLGARKPKGINRINKMG